MSLWIRSNLSSELFPICRGTLCLDLAMGHVEHLKSFGAFGISSPSLYKLGFSDVTAG